MYKLLNEALDTLIENNLYEYLLRINRSGFLVRDAGSNKKFSNQRISQGFRF